MLSFSQTSHPRNPSQPSWITVAICLDKIARTTKHKRRTTVHSNECERAERKRDQNAIVFSDLASSQPAKQQKKTGAKLRSFSQTSHPRNPATHPATQPPSHPATQPPSHPATPPHPQPASQPANQPASSKQVTLLKRLPPLSFVASVAFEAVATAIVRQRIIAFESVATAIVCRQCCF